MASHTLLIKKGIIRNMCTQERRQGTITIKRPYRRFSTIQKAISDSCFKNDVEYLLPNGNLTHLVGVLWERATEYKEYHKGKYPLNIQVTYIPTGTGFGKLQEWKFIK